MKLWSLTILVLVVPAIALATAHEQSKDVFARQYRNKNDFDDWFQQVERWIRSMMQQWGRLGRGGQGSPPAPSVGPVRTFTEADTITATTTICQRWYNCYKSVYTTTVNPRTFTETVIVHSTTAPCRNGGGNCIVITPSQSIQPATATQLTTSYGTTTSRACFWGYCGSPVTVTYTTTVTITVTYTATMTPSLTPITSPLSVSAALSATSSFSVSTSTDATVGATLTEDESSVTMGFVASTFSSDITSLDVASSATLLPISEATDSFISPPAALSTAATSGPPESLISSFTSSASAALSSLSSSDSAVLSSLSSSQASILSSLQSQGSPSAMSSVSSALSSSAESIQSSLSSIDSAVTSSLSSQQGSILGILTPAAPITDPSMTSSQASGLLTSVPIGSSLSLTPVNSILTKPSSGLTLTISLGLSTVVINPSTVKSSSSSTTKPSSSVATTLRTSTTTSSATRATSSVQATQTINVTGLTYINAMLAAHNAHRANHSLPALVWDASLAAIAGQIASNCYYAHNVTAGGGGYGQNIGAGAIGNAAAGLVTNLMYNNEINYYPTPYGNDNPDLSGFHFWGHYSQIVWTSTTNVGCVTQYCSQGLANTGTGVAPYFTVCNYSPPGNYVGEFSQVAAPKGGATVVIVGS